MISVMMVSPWPDMIQLRPVNNDDMIMSIILPKISETYERFLNEQASFDRHLKFCLSSKVFVSLAITQTCA